MPVYSALYRTWRPHRLADLVGQEHVSRTLRNALATGHTAHAYLFCGPRGTGKTSTARILAAALNCERPASGDACGACERCREVASDRLLDVQEIDAASNRQVEDMRALRETVGYTPVAARHKVYILDEVHMLTEASWNTLLKTLEEPPPATTFVLCTTDPRKVLATVVSRCQRFDFRRLTVGEISERLVQVCAAEGIGATPEALAAIARRADGGLRDALSILDQATVFVSQGKIGSADVANILGAADDAAVEHLISATRRGDAVAVFTEIERLYAEGKDMGQVVRDLLRGLRDLMVAALEGTESRTGSRVDPGQLQWLLTALASLAEIEGHMRRAEQPRLLLEVALVRLLPVGGEAGVAVAEIPAEIGQPGGGRGRESPGSRMVPAKSSEGVRAQPSGAALAGGNRMESTVARSIPAQAAPTLRRAATTPDWAAVLEALRRMSIPAHSTLQNGEYHGLVGDVVHVLFRYAGHAALAEGRREVIERAWQEISGVPARFEFIVDGNLRTPPARSASRTAPGPRDDQPPTPDAPPPDLCDDEHLPLGHDSSQAPSGPPPVKVARGALDQDARYRRAMALFEGTPLPAGSGDDAS